jgi:predicted Zn finger-like uncharacterized protein
MMKLTCPACNAEYTLATERLEGRRAKVRCKRCGDSFHVDAPTPSGAVCAPALTGERNESSVLFSVAMLAMQAQQPAPSAAQVTESSALIDIRALVSASPRESAATARADDIANLGGGGAFAPLFAPPVTFAPAENEQTARRGSGVVIVAAMALAVVAMVSAGALVSVRSRTSAPARTAVAAVAPPAEAPSVASVASIASESAPAPAPQVAVSTPTPTPAPARTSATSRTAAARAPAASAPSAHSAPIAAAKCCAGESEMACHMRLSVGASCGADAPARR